MFNLWKKNKSVFNLKELLKKAKENDMNAQYELSLAYYRGIHVPKNMRKSNYWFEKANSQGKSEGVSL